MGIFLERAPPPLHTNGDYKENVWKESVNVFQEFNGNEDYQTDLEDGFLFYYEINAFKKLFSKNEDQIKTPEELLEEEKFKTSMEDQIKAIEEDDDIEEDQKIVMILKIEREFEKRKQDLIKKENLLKKDFKLYLTMHDIHRYRLLKFFLFVCSVVLCFITYFRLIDRTLAHSETRDIMEVLYTNIFFNTIYKEMLNHPQAFKSKNLNLLLNSRMETNAYFNMMFNNVFFKSPNENIYQANNNIDIYNGYFQRANSYYEELGSIKMTVKQSISTETQNHSLYLTLPSYKDFQSYKRFTINEELTSPFNHSVNINFYFID